jgi:hypothetical protein
MPGSATRRPIRSTPAPAARSSSATESTITSAPSSAARASSAQALTGPLTMTSGPAAPMASRASAYSASHTTSWPAPSAARARRMAGSRLVL